MIPPVVLPLGREALTWVRQGGKPSRAGWPQQFMLRWQNHWFERNLSLQRQLPPARPLHPDPVFILGLWRSGTTYLHDLLSACPDMIYPANWQCMSPASFRLQSSPDKGKTVQRPMDGHTIDNLSPQEDEFALLALGVPSVYRGFFDPRRLPELTQWLDPNVWTGNHPVSWIDNWRQFLTGITDRNPGRLVLKSPNHSFRIQALAEAFPNATYVWLVRDPVDTFHSNRKMWLAMFERYALWSWDASLLDDFLTQAFEFAAESLGRATRLLSRDHLVVLPFDQLTGATFGSLEGLTRRLSLGNWHEMQPGVARVAATKTGYRPEAYHSNLLPGSALKALEKLRLAQHGALSSHGL